VKFTLLFREVGRHKLRCIIHVVLILLMQAAI
jgi:hypothetical protein